MATRRITLTALGFLALLGGCNDKRPYEKASSVLASRLELLGAANQALALTPDELAPALLGFATAQIASCSGGGASLDPASPAKRITDACQTAQKSCSDRTACRQALAMVDQAVAHVSAQAVGAGLSKDAFQSAENAARSPRGKAFLDSIKTLASPRPTLVKLEAAWQDPAASREALEAVCAAIEAEETDVRARIIPEGLDKGLVQGVLGSRYMDAHRRCNDAEALATVEREAQAAKKPPKLGPRLHCTHLKRLKDAGFLPASDAARVKALDETCP